MILVITGTPGTGKSTLCELLAERLGLVCYHLDELVMDGLSLGYDRERDSLIADIDGIREKLGGVEDAVVEGHYAHLLGIGDIIIVLRTNPRVLEKRLRDKGFSEEKIRENLECEALDMCLVESLERGEEVFEVDTTELKPAEALEAILNILDGRGDEYRPGKIDWSEEYF
jgi:adenylate kinase